MGSDPRASGTGVAAEPWEELESSSNFQRASAGIKIIFICYPGILLLAPNQTVIGDYSPSSRTLLLRTQMPVSHAVIITWDAFLQSLLSCPSGQLFTSRSASRHQPKRIFWIRIPLQVSYSRDSIPSRFPFLAGPRPLHNSDFTGFQRP